MGEAVFIEDILYPRSVFDCSCYLKLVPNAFDNLINLIPANGRLLGVGLKS